MKASDNLKELYPKVNSLLGEIDSQVKESIKQVKKEYTNMLVDEKVKMLKLICEGEKLNFVEMKNKYLSDKEKKLVVEQVENVEYANEELLDTVEINGTIYYYENKEKGTIYDSKSKVVGSVKNGVPVLNH